MRPTAVSVSVIRIESNRASFVTAAEREPATRERTNERTSKQTADRAIECTRRIHLSLQSDNHITPTHPFEKSSTRLSACCLAVRQGLLCDVRRCDRRAHLASKDADSITDPQALPTNRPFQLGDRIMRVDMKSIHSRHMHSPEQSILWQVIMDRNTTAFSSIQRGLQGWQAGSHHSSPLKSSHPFPGSRLQAAGSKHQAPGSGL